MLPPCQVFERHANVLVGVLTSKNPRTADMFVRACVRGCGGPRSHVCLQPSCCVCTASAVRDTERPPLPTLHCAHTHTMLLCVPVSPPRTTSCATRYVRASGSDLSLACALACHRPEAHTHPALVTCYCPTTSRCSCPPLVRLGSGPSYMPSKSKPFRHCF
jgi:hypothetical protein